MSDLNDAELVKRERAWNRKSTTWVWVAGFALSALTTPFVIRFMQTHPRWTDTEFVAGILAFAVLLAIPSGIWIERQRRQQPAAIFGARAAELQIDHLQHRLSRAMVEFIAVSSVIFLCQEALASGYVGRPFISGKVYGPYWIVIMASGFATARTAWCLSRRGWAPARMHPYIKLVMQDERVEAARLEAIRQAYPAIVVAAAVAYGAVAIDLDLARYVLPMVLLLAVATPALIWRVSLRGECAEDAG